MNNPGVFQKQIVQLILHVLFDQSVDPRVAHCLLKEFIRTNPKELPRYRNTFNSNRLWESFSCLSSYGIKFLIQLLTALMFDPFAFNVNMVDLSEQNRRDLAKHLASAISH